MLDCIHAYENALSHTLKMELDKIIETSSPEPSIDLNDNVIPLSIEDTTEIPAEWILPSEDNKTLAEEIAEENLPKPEVKAEPELDIITIEETPEDIEKKEELKEEIKEIQKSNKTDKEIIEEMADMFYEHEEKLKLENKKLKIQNEQLEAENTKLLKQLNEIKYDGERVKIDDPIVGHYVSLKEKQKQNPKDWIINNKIVRFHLDQIQWIRPEFDVAESINSMNSKRRAMIEAISNPNSAWSGATPVKEEPVQVSRPKWYAIA